MTRLHRIWNRARCHAIGTHDLDWLMQQMSGARQCKRCLTAMPEPVPAGPPPFTPLPDTVMVTENGRPISKRRRTVGETSPDCGD